jgi:hypothetical protein
MISILSRVGVSTRRMRAAASAIAATGHDASRNHAELDAADGPWRIIRDRYQIEHVVRHLLDTEQGVTLTGRSQLRSARSRILGIDSAGGGHLLVERVADDGAHAGLLRDGFVNLGSRFLEMPVVCTIDIAQSAEAAGKSCYRAPLPHWLLFSDMRDAPRVCLPDAEPAKLVLSGPGRAPVEAAVFDLSEGGAGLWWPQMPSYRPAVGDRWMSAMLHTHDGETCTLNLELRHVSSTLDGGHRLGVTIRPASGNDRQRLHRLIVRHQMLFTEPN